MRTVHLSGVGVKGIIVGGGRSGQPGRIGRVPNCLSRLRQINPFSGWVTQARFSGRVTQTNEPCLLPPLEDSKMESLLSCLAKLERNLREEGNMEITDEEAKAVVKRVVEAVGVGTNTPAGVRVAPVHTYVHRLDKSSKPWHSPSIVVPPFACHWGIVVGSPGRQRLFHLLFVEDAGREVEGSRVENKYIRFHDSKLQKSLGDTKEVGHTRYNTDELEALGTAMIREFGDYHKVFWNCQTFAKCYLRVITGDYDAKFDEWTSADTSRLFLCAFLVGAPFATTNKVKENAAAERLVRKIEMVGEDVSVEDRSAHAIEAIYESLKQDASWGGEVGLVEDTTSKAGFLDGLLNVLFGKKN